VAGTETGKEIFTMSNEAPSFNLRDEVEGLFDCLNRGDPYASVHLARLVEADTKGTLRPFAEALTARLCDHLNRYAELGVSDPYVALEDEVYNLAQKAAVDWNGMPKSGRPGEEA
jgi:hypothetical protein